MTRGGHFWPCASELQGVRSRAKLGFHLGFYVDSEDLVTQFHARAKGDGLEVSEVIRNNRGTMVYCTAPGGLLIEVNCRPRAA
ncbi:VOC family protein [Myxococcus xanthus]|nr:VOC family protein [Myxococcus xanthus]QPM83537.1 VOC family protein [Myxococcus xanthus]QVW72099.1 VOC family protein [Myxococcus xanthus DZ2]UEO08418.1 VOC family protein [Myxococcus xanthus DZ2]